MCLIYKMINYPSELQVGEHVYPIEYFRVLKVRSSVRIKNGAVVLKLSRFVHGGKRDEIVERFLKWAEKRLSNVSKIDFIAPIYEDGGRIVTHNKIYELSVNVVSHAMGGRGGDSFRSRLIDGHFLQINLPVNLKMNLATKTIQNLAEKLIIKDQTFYLQEVLQELNQLYFQENFNNCRFKRTNGRFGSCSSRRNINIAFRLLFAPREIFRYVCVHELAHLKEFNHSKRFWDLVAQAMPNYKKSEKWLRNSGFLLG